MRSQHRAWEAIAESFDRNRTRRWDHVEAWCAALPAGSRVLDLMAGNGRHVASLLGAGHETVWADWSRPAARIAAQRYRQAAVVVADATLLPFPDGSFDAILWVAGLHSLPSPEGRAAALHEATRVLRSGGCMQLTVWSREAPRFRTLGEAGRCLDVDIPWRAHGHDEVRHYHLYTRQALRGEVESAGLEVLSQRDVAIVSPEPDNLVLEARKP